MSSVEYSSLENSSLINLRKTSLLGKWVGLVSSWQSTSYLMGYGDIIATVLICLVIIFAPFTSNSLLGVILLAGGGFWILSTLSEVKKNQFTSIHLWVLIYWLICVVATAFSPLKIDALSGLVKFTLYLLFFALGSRVLGDKKLRSWITSSYILVSVVISAYGIRQKILGVKPLATWTDPESPLADYTRVYSYLGNPNLLGSYLILAVAFTFTALVVWKTPIQKIFAGFALLLHVACIYFTGSRGGWLALLVTGLILLVGLKFWWGEYFSPFWRKWLIPIVLGGFFFILAAGILLVEPLRLRIFSLFSWRGDSSNNFRINVWIAALQMLRDYPLTGIGLGNKVFNQIYPLYMQTKFTALSAYSIFLEITLESGILGITAFLGIIVATCQRAIALIKQMRNNNNIEAMWIIGAIAAIGGLATQGLVDTVWFRPQINTLWWLAVATVASFPLSLSGMKQD